jgi:uncharacterized membrane protein
MGYSLYDVMLWFIIYSFLGWVVESIYMSFCNKKLTNRGFSRGPMCPIYGVGAVSVYFILKPYSNNLVFMFFAGMFLATAIEYFTAKVMLRFFGEVWWDYNDKPFNYKGILCLESSLAWGVYALIFFTVGHNAVMEFVDSIPTYVGALVGTSILIVYAIDFMQVLYQEKKEVIHVRYNNVNQKRVTLIEKVKEKISNIW